MSEDLTLFEQKNIAFFKKLAEFKMIQKKMEAEEEKIKLSIQKSMEEHGIKSFKNDVITISYIEGSTSTSIDLKKLQEKEPECYEGLIADYPKVTTKKPYVKFQVK